MRKTGQDNQLDCPEGTTLQEVILQTWLSAFGDTKVSYISGPITTGPRFIEWFETEGKYLQPEEFSAEKRKKVIQPNSNDIIKEAERIRAFWPVTVVEPASFFIREWSQEDYLELWTKFIETHVDRLLFMSGWETSVGCVIEYCRAVEHGKERLTLDGAPIAIDRAVALVEKTLETALASQLTDKDYLNRLTKAAAHLRSVAKIHLSQIDGALQKDESLDLLAQLANVAQFVSFRPVLGAARQSFSRLHGLAPNHSFESVVEAATALLERSADNSINVRSYAPDDSQSREFIYGIKSADEAAQAVARLSSEGLWTIINETVDVSDGGVSGVYWDDLIEFSPDDTPRVVEKGGVCALPSGMGLRILESVYGFAPDFSLAKVGRLEFSLHPKPRGWRRTNTLAWEFAPGSRNGPGAVLLWPNNFSKLIGDKVFGLLVAHEVGLPVPKTLVIPRRVAPFVFGRSTGTSETWIRTAPFEQEPGLYTTERGWRDPFALFSTEDPDHSGLASVVSQQGVNPLYSGASIVLADGTIRTEGVKGAGDQFMVGAHEAEALPSNVIDLVRALHERASVLGAVRFEWVFDGQAVWIVQLHRGQTSSMEDAIVSGEAREWVLFDPSDGLSALRHLLSGLGADFGVQLTRGVGLTSHVADVIRKSGHPARVVRS